MEKEVPIDQIQHYLTHLDEDEEDIESESDQSIFEFIKIRLKNLYIENIPVEAVKDLPSKAKYILGTICYILALLIFLYFTIANYETEIHKKFISLTKDSGICRNVPISVTMSFYADLGGNWQGTNYFQEYLAVYRFEFSNYIAQSLNDYKKMMGVYYDSLEYIGRVSQNQNLGLNAILWASFVRYFSPDDPYTRNFTDTGTGNLQYVELAGDPAVIFDSRFTGGVISSSAGICDLPIKSNFDQANSLFTGIIDVQEGMNNSLCSPVLQAFTLQQDVFFNPIFPLYLDARSIATAVAVNLHFSSVNDLVLASGYRIPLSFGDGINFTVAKYYDVRYPYMQPIYCMKNTTVFPSYFPDIRELCFISTGPVISLPVINHFGNSYEVPEYCDCLTNGASDMCNNLLMMASMIVFDLDTAGMDETESELNYLMAGIFLMVEFDGYAGLNRQAFEAQSASVLTALGTADESIVDDVYFNNTFTSLCPSDYPCALITFFTRSTSQAISKYHFPLFYGSCNNMITPDPEAWQTLTNKPPTPLNENYYECYPTQLDALTSAIGISSGNTSIALLVLVFVIAPIVILIRAYCVELPREQEYSQKEKYKTLDTLATLLLRVRDEHYEGLNAREKTNIAAITEEMIQAIRYSNHVILSESGKFSEEYLRSMEETIKHRQLLGKSLIYRHTKPLKPIEDQPEVGNTITADGGEIVPSRPNPLVKQRTHKLSPQKTSRRGLTHQRTFMNYDALNGSGGDNELGGPSQPQTMRLKVLNLIEVEIPDENDAANWKAPYASNNLRVLVDGLMHYFTNAIRNQDQRERSALVPTHLRDTALGTTSVNHPHPAENTPLYLIDPDYAKGCILSKKLTEINVKELLNQDDPNLFTSLANSLCMHASLDGHKSMHQIAERYGDHYSYQIGDKVFLYSTLTAYAYHEDP